MVIVWINWQKKIEQIDKRKASRYIYVMNLMAILICLGALCLFKYYNFFVDSLQIAFQYFENNTILKRLDIILPLGISFYVFQSLTYTIDI